MRSQIADLELARIRTRLKMPPREQTWWERLGSGDKKMLAIAAGNIDMAHATWAELSPARRTAILGARARAARWALEIDPNDHKNESDPAPAA